MTRAEGECAIDWVRQVILTLRRSTAIQTLSIELRFSIIGLL